MKTTGETVERCCSRSLRSRWNSAGCFRTQERRMKRRSVGLPFMSTTQIVCIVSPHDPVSKWLACRRPECEKKSGSPAAISYVARQVLRHSLAGRRMPCTQLLPTRSALARQPWTSQVTRVHRFPRGRYDWLPNIGLTTTKNSLM